MAATPRSVTVLWIGVGIMAFIGAVAATLRMVEIMDNRALYHGRTEAMSPRETVLLQGLIGISIRPDSASYRDAAADVVAFSKRYNAKPGVSILHLAPSLVFMLLAPFQFSKRLRARHIRVHRWTGRVLLLLTLPIAASAVYFGVVIPVAGAAESIAFTLFGALFLLSAMQGYRAIRNRQVSRHREWMIRLLALAAGVSVMRVISGIFGVVTMLRPLALFMPSVWAGWIISLGVAELWIRHTRARKDPSRVSALQTA